MPGPRQSIDDYLKSRLAQLHDLGGVMRQAIVNIFDELGVATLHAWVTFGESESGLLSVYEVVVIGHDRAPHGAKYGYHCEHDGVFLFRYDPTRYSIRLCRTTSISRPTSAESPPTE